MAECGDEVVSAKICRRLDGACTMTKEIIDNDYENVFSWHIIERTGEKQNLMMNFLDTIREKCDFVIVEEDVFNVNRFCYQLIIVYELYVLGTLDKSLQEIEIIVKYIDSCKFDETSNHYLAAYKHIACSTFAYIALSMNCYSEKIIENVKPINNLNQTEKSAICAVKACVFMEYPPNGNAIALKLANEARNFNSEEPQWIVIWLKAKGRIRRFNNIKMPDKDEIEAADILSLEKNPKPQFLINACKIYHDMAVFNRIINNKEKSQTYFKLGFDLLIDASKLINYDVKDLYSCLFAFLFAPKEFQSRIAIYQIVEKLKTINNNCAVYDALGEFYFKYEKDYEKAKIYFSRGMFFGHFRCSMQLLKVECLLNPYDSFSYIQTLKNIYEVFASPKRRLIILKQMLLFYYDTKNPKELMNSLKLFLDQDIEDRLKMQYLIDSQSFYNLCEDIKHKPFVNILHDYISDVRKNYKWNAEEKMVVDNTCALFNKISKVNRTYDNQFNKNNKKNFHQQCYEWKLGKKYNYNSNLQYDEARNHETNWRKKQETDNEVGVCNPFTKNGNKTNGKHMSQKKEISKHQKEKFENNVNESLVKEFNKHLTICPATEKVELNKLKNQHGHNKNLLIPNSKNDPLLYETTENNTFNLKNKYQDRHWMAQHNNESNIQDQDKNNLLPNNAKVIHSSPPHIKEKNKNKNWNNYQDYGFKDKHKFVTSKLDCQFQPARNLYDQSKQH